MKYKQENYDDAWLDRLDAIASGNDVPTPEDDDLLHVAGKLSATLAPLQEMDSAADLRRHRLSTRLRTQLIEREHITKKFPFWSLSRSSARRWLARSLVAAVAVLLFLALGPGLLFEIKPAPSTNTPGGLVGVGVGKGPYEWTMRDLSSPYSYTIPAPDKLPQGVTLLIPTQVPPNAYVIEISATPADTGSGMDIQSYLIFSENVLLYETPVDALPPEAFKNPAYETVYIGDIKGLLEPGSGGYNRLEWYQDGFVCDLVGKLTVGQLITIARQLR